MLEDYIDVRTGQDLIDKGVVPKDSSSHLALIVHKRLKALRDHTLASLTNEILGRWQPLIQPETKTFPETTAIDEIKRTAQIGHRVQGTGIYDGLDLTGLEGTIRTNPDGRGQYGIEFDQPIDKGGDLKGLAQKKDRGWLTAPSAFKLLAGHIVTGHKLSEGVVADKDLGHRVRFAKAYQGRAADSKGNVSMVQIPEDTRGMITEYHPKNSTVTLTLTQALPDQGNRVVYNMPVSDLEKIAEVSSLGQLEPLQKEQAVNRQVLSDFFPTTALDHSLSEIVILSLLMGKDMIFYGPAGSGKTNLVRDVIGLAKQQRFIFTVDGCQVQCNPYSVFDEAFAKVVPPCPECRINYDPTPDKRFKKTGLFQRPKPGDVKVVVAKYGEGHGIEFLLGTRAVNRMHLAGYKLPKLDGTTTDGRENDYDPEGFRPGILLRA
ncbi:MAG: ATP-binding protein [Nanoarchaeota archaeon]